MSADLDTLLLVVWGTKVIPRSSLFSVLRAGDFWEMDIISWTKVADLSLYFLWWKLSHKRCNIIFKRQCFSIFMTSLTYLKIWRLSPATYLSRTLLYISVQAPPAFSELYLHNICWDKAGLLAWFHKQGGQTQEENWKFGSLLWDLGKSQRVADRTTRQPGPSGWIVHQIWPFCWIQGILDYALKCLGKCSLLK